MVCGTQASTLTDADHWGFTCHGERSRESVDLSSPELLWRLCGALGQLALPGVICSWISFSPLPFSEVRKSGFGSLQFVEIPLYKFLLGRLPRQSISEAIKL